VNKFKLENFVKGWFIGNFDPSLDKAEGFEVAVKDYKKGDSEEKHYHKISTEYTVIAQGKALFNDQEFSKGDIAVIEKGESTSFEALEDTITVVVKVPSSKNDKFLGDLNEDNIT